MASDGPRQTSPSARSIQQHTDAKASRGPKFHRPGGNLFAVLKDFEFYSQALCILTCFGSFNVTFRRPTHFAQLRRVILLTNPSSNRQEFTNTGVYESRRDELLVARQSIGYTLREVRTIGEFKYYVAL